MTTKGDKITEPITMAKEKEEKALLQGDVVTAEEVKAESQGLPPKHDWHRMWPWWIISGVLVGIISYFKPDEIPVLVWKISLLSLAAAMGYWVDRSAFPYGRPDQLVDLRGDDNWSTGEALVFGVSMIRRAMIMSAFMYASAVAL